ncbi:hypothetical protein [Undibacterium flavidum]|uniref:DUF3575 domain-containing protein n=1 Tax=Undibacterium flavidum TaxID=2762297 RepID=A0ABR6YHV5_9BURK|nr:hypothetical protein [Undibacterium flavidum]MBC3876113.1 hypothetical protein [Undibacterium flavidum]
MKAITICILAFSIVSYSYADENTPSNYEKNKLPTANEPSFNVVLGVSLESILGFEYQKENHVIGLGLPGAVSYKWFKNPYGDSIYFGAYAGKFSNPENNEVRDGVFYKNYRTSFVGAGIGYRWQWPSGFNVTTSIALNSSKIEYSNPNSSKIKNKSVLGPLPGIIIGYKF